MESLRGNRMPPKVIHKLVLSNEFYGMLHEALACPIARDVAGALAVKH